jgi:hypothetical protein
VGRRHPRAAAANYRSGGNFIYTPRSVDEALTVAASRFDIGWENIYSQCSLVFTESVCKGNVYEQHYNKSS